MDGSRPGPRARLKGDELVTRSVALPRGELRLLQPRESAELPDSGGVEWAPIAPYWSVLWRSGVALAGELEEQRDLAGIRVLELGCGLGVPSLAAARAGASVVATDADPEAIELLPRNAQLNDSRLEAARIDWEDPRELLRQAPFDLVLAADVLYERDSVAPLLELLPRLGTEVWVADPGRRWADTFLAGAASLGRITTTRRGVVGIHRLRSRSPAPTERAGGEAGDRRGRAGES